MMMMNAGPAANAEARKRGPIRELFQNGRAGRPAKRNAVTMWILTAQKTDRYTNGT
jgi:hypothetical protein